MTFVKTELRWSDGSTEEINGTYITEVGAMSLLYYYPASFPPSASPVLFVIWSWWWCMMAVWESV